MSVPSQKMPRTSDIYSQDVPHSKTTASATPDPTADNEEAMQITKLFTFGSIIATTTLALRRPYSLELESSHPDNEGPVRRLRTSMEGDLSAKIPGYPYILTVYDLAKSAQDEWGDKAALGSRKVVKQHAEQKQITKMINGVEQQVNKTWYYSELSPFYYRTYTDLGTESTAIGAGLRELGVNPGDNVGLYAETSPEWQIFAQGCVSQSMPIVTAYAALGKEGLTHSLSQTKAKAIFTEAALLKNLADILQQVSDLHYIVYRGEADEQLLRTLRKTRQIQNVTSYEELIEIGIQNPHTPTPPTSSDVACIMYTSGSTGPPKGVVLTHQNVIAAVAGVDNAIASDRSGALKVDEDDRFLCFLPLAHILEFVYELCAIHWGGTIGYGNPRTLTQDSVRNCQGDIQEFKPTVLVAVPAVWEKIKKKVDANVAAKPALVRALFWTGFKLKSKMLDWGMSGSLFNPLFKKVREATGGSVRLTISGGAPLALETQKFLSVTHAPLLVGYGLTETTAMAAISTPDTLEYGAVGIPTSSIEIKLVDIPDMKYLHSNDPPQGEIWLRGPSIASGYYMNDEETQKAFTSDGWFKTGDVGQWQPSGTLTIIDRVKNLVKTLNGEYIALEKLESAYRTAQLVDNVCILAFPQKAKPIAIVVPDEKALRNLVEKNSIADKSTDFEELVKRDDVKAIVMKDILAAGKISGLQGIELVSGVILAPDIWTPENGLVTAAMKLSRRNIEKAFANEIETLLANTD